VKRAAPAMCGMDSPPDNLGKSMAKIDVQKIAHCYSLRRGTRKR
jgi:hypothetical protein